MTNVSDKHCRGRLELLLLLRMLIRWMTLTMTMIIRRLRQLDSEVGNRD
jgi:hypothetical protein